MVHGADFINVNLDNEFITVLIYVFQNENLTVGERLRRFANGDDNALRSKPGKVNTINIILRVQYPVLKHMIKFNAEMPTE